VAKITAVVEIAIVTYYIDTLLKGFTLYTLSYLSLKTAWCCKGVLTILGDTEA
jgi:hypothetical protein